MSDLKMLVWLSQLGLSVIVPLACCIGVALWIQQRFMLDAWVIFVGLALGIVCAAQGFRATLAAMNRMAQRIHEDKHGPTEAQERD